MAETPPALNLGARLVQQGHAVRLVGSQSMAARAIATGVEFATYPSVPPLPTDVALEEIWEERVLPRCTAATRDEIVAAGRDFDPDVLVIDCMMNAGFDAAHALGLPSVVLMHLLYSFSHTHGVTRLYPRPGPASSTTVTRCSRSSLPASMPSADYRPMRPTSARLPPPTPTANSIDTTPPRWPSPATRGCCSV